MLQEEAYAAEGEHLPHIIGPGMGHAFHPDTRAEVMRRLTAEALFSRWSRMAAVAAASSWAGSVLSEAPDAAEEGFLDGGAPWLPDLLCDESPA